VICHYCGKATSLVTAEAQRRGEESAPRMGHGGTQMEERENTFIETGTQFARAGGHVSRNASL